MRTTWMVWGMLLTTVVVAEEPAELPPYLERAGDNYAYVLSDARGWFYLRAIPGSAHGDAGTTRVYRVQDDGQDELLTTYKWYSNPLAAILCGNPDTNQLAVVIHYRSVGLDIRDVKNEPVLKFFADGTLLATYRVEDLVRLGAPLKQLSPELFYTQDYEVEGCKRLGKKLYAFTLRTPGERRIQFDITSGEVLTSRNSE